MKRLSLIFIMMAITGVVFISSAHAWLYYSKPAFRGRVIDAETKKPIEGVVVVVLYMKWEFGGPGGGNTLPMDAKETLTDKYGEFYFSSYKTIIGPLSREDCASFIIYKPGYMSVTRIEATKLPDEKYFAIDKDMIGKEGEIKNIDMFGNPETWKGILGVVELEKGERDPLVPSDYRSKELPLLYKAINQDRRNRGYKGEVN